MLHGSGYRGVARNMVSGSAVVAHEHLHYWLCIKKYILKILENTKAFDIRMQTSLQQTQAKIEKTNKTEYVIIY